MKILGLLLFLGISGKAAGVSSKPTFNKDVAPILQANCQGCHRPGEAAPMSFLEYKETRKWAKAIREAVVLRKMPPWFADRAHGKFSNDRSLSQSDIDTIKSWVDAGAPEGDPNDLPVPKSFVQGWNIGPPDVTFEMPSEFRVPANGTIEYQYIVIPTGFREDKWIQMAEVRPGNRAVVHHVIAFVRAPGSKWLKDAVPGVPYVPPKRQGNSEGGEDGAGGEFLVGYAPGTVPETLEPGQAKLIKAGSDLVFQMHYTANGKAATDKTTVGLIFSKEPPKERVLTVAAMTRKFVIPAGAPNHRVDSSLTLDSTTRLIAMLPHMHLRGKSFEYRAVYPTGESETLLRVPRYDFNWQLSYYLDKPKVLPKGTRIECTAHFDNSANNPANPDPKTEVRWGDQSWEEMMIGFLDIAFDAGKDPSELFPKKRRGAAATE